MVARPLTILYLSTALIAPSAAFAVQDGTSFAPGLGLRTYREDHPPGTRGPAISETAKSEPGARADKVHGEQCALSQAGFAEELSFCD
jgi:hypothetical protein